MASGLGMVLGTGAAVAAASSVVAYVRLRWRAAQVRRRHDDFAARFKQSGFVELPPWDELDTLPMPSASPLA